MMSIPEKCTTLIVGGGPGGSYTASVLAREGIDVVLLEADKFPRYHIGESMLPSFRHYLKFIDLHHEFDTYGFMRKNGAAIKMSPKNPEGWTDFLAAGGEENYAWNVVRSEADDMMFRHAGISGAKTYDQVQVTSISFDHSNGYGPSATDAVPSLPSPGRPVSAVWKRKADGAEGEIKFDYIVDATGRSGLLNTKYVKNRQYNTTLKNVAHWAYFSGAGLYGKGTARANSPFFEALEDESGWAWFIPLHNGTHSIGIVMNQDIATEKKRNSASVQAFFEEALTTAPAVREMLSDAKRVAEIKAASDYSYNSKAYAFPYARVVGDAGCFIDPFFSSGVHLAVTGGLAAATSICASIRGDCDEKTAAQWHSNKIREGYARFLLVVLSAYKQMRNQKHAVLSGVDEDNFDRAFTFFKPIIQGTADATSKITQAELDKTLEFLTKAYEPSFHPQGVAPATKAEVEANGETDGHTSEATLGPMLDKQLADSDREAMSGFLQSQKTHTINMDSFTTDIIDGRVPKLERGHLTLVLAA